MGTGIQAMNALNAWRRGGLFFWTHLLKALALFAFAIAVFCKLYMVLA
jgi:hypothetical protein